MTLGKLVLSILLLQVNSISWTQDALTLKDGGKAFTLNNGSLFIGELIEGRPYGKGSNHTQSSTEISEGRWDRGSREGIFIVLLKVRKPSYQLFQSNELIYETKIRSDWSGTGGFQAGLQKLRWKVYEIDHFQEINFYDDRGVNVSSEVRNVWELTDFVSPQNGTFFKGALSRLSNIEFHCAQKQLRAISAYCFSECQRAGQVIDTARYMDERQPDSRWQGVIPGTVDEVLFTKLCGR